MKNAKKYIIQLIIFFLFSSCTGTQSVQQTTVNNNTNNLNISVAPIKTDLHNVLKLRIEQKIIAIHCGSCSIFKIPIALNTAAIKELSVQYKISTKVFAKNGTTMSDITAYDVISTNFSNGQKTTTMEKGNLPSEQDYLIVRVNNLGRSMTGQTIEIFFYVSYKDNREIQQDSAMQTFIVANAVHWKSAGNCQFSKGETDNNKLIIAPDGTKYIAFRDFSDNIGKITVMSNDKDDADWKILGNANFSVGRVDNISIASTVNSIIYVSFTDEGRDGKAVVMAYDKANNNWKNVGDAVSQGLAKDTSIAIDPTTDIPYVAFSDYSNRRDGFAQVMFYDKSDNTWKQLGKNDAITNARANFNSLAFAADGTVYLAFSTYGFTMGRALVVTYNKTNSAWEICGGYALSSGVAEYISLAIAPDNTPYLAYADQSADGKATVLFYDKTYRKWAPVVNQWISDGYSQFTSLAVAKDGTLYLAFKDSANGGQATVVTFDKSAKKWNPLARQDGYASDNRADYISIAVNKDGTPYVAYADGSETIINKATAMKYVENTSLSTLQ